MKQLLPLLLVLMIGFSGYSQNAKKDAIHDYVMHVLPAKAPTQDAINLWHANNPFVDAPGLDVLENTVGDTWYDMQTNTSIGNRIYLHPDGTMGAVWTRGEDDAPGFANRGTGYNYFDGNDWGPIPDDRLESLRCGWPSYAPWGPNGEIIVSHHTSINALAFSLRENKGTGDWTQFDYPGSIGTPVDPSWPRMATSGEDHEYIHVFYNSYNAIGDFGQRMYYSRSMDGGESWDPEDVIIDGTGDDSYYDLDGDDQVLAVSGSTVVMLNTSKWTDVFILKSTDHGDTWEKTIVWKHPYPMFNFDETQTDTMWAADGDGSVTIDNDGKVHVVFGICMCANLTPGGGTYNVWTGPYIDGIVYWNEDMPQLGDHIKTLSPPVYEYPESELDSGINYIGYTQDMDGNGTIDMEPDKIISYRATGVSCWPNIICDDDGLLFVTWSSANEEYSNFDFYYKKIWARAFVNDAWGPFLHITEPFVHIFDESVYPCLSPTSDANIYMLYQNDGEPGHNMNGTPDHDALLNSMIVSTIPKTDFIGVGIGENQMVPSLNVTQNFPNPCYDHTSLSVYLEQRANLTLEVTNLIGQSVEVQERGAVPKGTHHFTIDVSQMESGIYFYTVKAGSSSVTKKMIVK